MVKSQPVVLIWVEANDLLSITDCNIVFINESLEKIFQEGAIIFNPHIPFCDLHPILRISILFATPTNKQV